MTSMGQPPAATAHSVETRIATDVSCGRCGHNLRTLPFAGVCTECGTPIELSLLGEHFSAADPRWANSIHRGLRGALRLLPWLWFPLTWPLFIAAYWRITESDPSRHSSGRASSALLLRLFGVVLFPAALVILALLQANSPTLRGVLSGFDAERGIAVLIVAICALAPPLLTLAVLQLVAGWGHLKHLRFRCWLAIALWIASAASIFGLYCGVFDNSTIGDPVIIWSLALIFSVFGQLGAAGMSIAAVTGLKRLLDRVAPFGEPRRFLSARASTAATPPAE